ncbi:TRAP transporter small permease [Salinarimonas soli]|uniref:TRAP transporter small permease protein n=1 Tax=Salinarimonas soli TaxID=1638099 RepID=A0A5B2VHX2_9HYPH|nr:TRAP transporter small permease [Salinarimonas soli]KAA2238218.1 TRAP transporter small permease [Salinarimonas soli]
MQDQPGGGNAAAPADAERPAARVLRVIEGAVSLLTRGALALSGGLLLAILGLIAYSVIWRYLFNAPKPWVDEVAGWLLVASVMLALPEVQRRNDHIGIDFLHQRLRDRPAARLVLGFGVFTVLVSSAILVREGVTMVEFTQMLGILSNQIPEVPLWAVQAFVPLGFGLMALVALVQLACLSLGILPHAMRDSLHGEVA